MSGFSWQWEFVWEILPSLLEGMRTTVFVTVCGSLIAVVLGLAVTLVRLAGIPVVSIATTCLVHLFRGTPLLIQLYFLFFILPGYGMTLSPIATGILGLGLYSTAMASEIYRAGIEAVPRAQWEASHSLSLPIWWVWARVVLPQAIRSVIPMLGNLVVSMFKESTVLSAIAVTEVLSTARQVAQENFRFIEPYTIVALLFFVVSYAAVLSIRRLERWSFKGG